MVKFQEKTHRSHGTPNTLTDCRFTLSLLPYVLLGREREGGAGFCSTTAVFGPQHSVVSEKRSRNNLWNDYYKIQSVYIQQ